MGAIFPWTGALTKAQLQPRAPLRGMNIRGGPAFQSGGSVPFLPLLLGYLGWFISAWVLIAATAAVLSRVVWRRQFASDAIFFAALDG